MQKQQHRALLIVEDNATNLGILKAIFQRGYDLFFAANGDDALSLLTRKQVLPDLILLNIVMPGTDGYQVCKQIKADPDLQSIPVIFLTGKDTREDEAAGLALGAADYITAPIDPAIVRQRVNTHLELKLYRDLLQDRLHATSSELVETQKVAETVEKRFKGFLKTAPIGLAIIAERKFIWVNDLVNLYGYSADEMVGQDSRMVYPSDEEYERVGLELFSQLQEHDIGATTARLRRKNGSLIDALIRSSLLDPANPARGMVIVVSDITELMMSRRELEKSETRYKLVQELTKIGSWEYDLKTREMFWSDSLFQIMGRARLAGSMTLETIIPWFSTAAAKAITDMLDQHLGEQEKRHVDIEIAIETPAGATKYLSFLSELHFGEDGKPAYIFGAVQDISDRKLLEIEMTRSFEERDAVFNATSNMVLVLNRDMRILRANRAVYQMLGRENGSLLGMDFVQAFGKGQMSPDCPLPITINTLQETSSIVEDMVPGHTFLVLASPVRSQKGQVDYFVVNARDVTELNKANERVRQREEQLTTLINATPDFIVFKNCQGGWILANQAALELYRLENVDFLGLTDSQLAEQSSSDLKSSFLVCEQSDEECWASGETLRIEETIIDTSGHERVFDVIKVPVFEGDGTRKGLIVWGRDLTEIKQLQKTTNRTTRLAALGELAAGVAHEINNPNALILYNCEFLKEFFNSFVDVLGSHKDILKDKKIGEMPLESALAEVPSLLDSASDAALRIKQIVKDLGDFSRQDGRESEVGLDINEIVQMSIRLVENSLKKATDCFSVELGDAIPVIMGIKGRLEQVVVNLLLNASQALTDRSQEVRISTSYDNDKEMVVFAVQDGGRGIPEDIQAQILEPFVTTRREQGGTGLGLSVSSRIVKEHNGQIVFESAVGKGTTFRVELPVCHKRDE